MKKDKSQKLTKLSPGEAELLELYWQHGPLTLPKAYELYTDTDKKPSYSTIQTRLPCDGPIVLRAKIEKVALTRKRNLGRIRHNYKCREK